MEFKYRSEANQFYIKLWILRSDANVVILKNKTNEAQWFCILKSEKNELSFF